MNPFAETALVAFLLAGGTNAAGIYQPQPQPTVQEVPQAIPKIDVGDIPPPAAAQRNKPREVSREGIEYLQRLRKNTPFGTNDFDLAALAGRHGIAPRAHHQGRQAHSHDRSARFPVNGSWRPARTPICGCCICTAAASSRGRADSISRWRRTSRRRPSVPCSSPTTGWHRSTASPPGSTIVSAPTNG